MLNIPRYEYTPIFLWDKILISFKKMIFATILYCSSSLKDSQIEYLGQDPSLSCHTSFSLTKNLIQTCSGSLITPLSIHTYVWKNSYGQSSESNLRLIRSLENCKILFWNYTCTQNKTFQIEYLNSFIGKVQHRGLLD